MRINVGQLLKETVGSSRSYKIDTGIDEEGINSVTGEITLTRTNRSILVVGTMTAKITGICSRCLNQASCTFNFNVEEEFFPRADMASGSIIRGESDNSNTIDNNNMLDLTEAIRQYTMLSMPTKLLCRYECAGLCLSCGQDLNQGLCQCSSQIYIEHPSKLVSLGKENST
jgi:uncharacterized protein